MDEAHQIRQPSTCINARIQELRNLQPHARMLLLTATPYINCAVDVVSLLAAAAADWSLLNYMGLPTQQHYARLLINSDDDRSWLKGIKYTEHLETLDMRSGEAQQYNELISDFINTYDHCTAHVKGSSNVRGSLMRLRRQLEAPCNLSAAESAKMGRMVEISAACRPRNAPSCFACTTTRSPRLSVSCAPNSGVRCSACMAVCQNRSAQSSLMTGRVRAIPCLWRSCLLQGLA